MNSQSEKSEPRRLSRFRPAAVAIALLSWTMPRIGFLKFSEAFAIMQAPFALASGPTRRTLIRCYWPFILATVISLGIAMLMIGSGDNTLTSEKGLYSSPLMVPFATLLRIVAYLLTVAAITHYFSVTSEKRVSTTLKWAYYLSVFPGLLQILRIYSGVHFNLPFERSGFGPFSGVYDAGYLRVMGFEFEPLAYASSLIVVCCISMHNGRRIPWLGLIVLWHTYGVGAIAGAILALFVSTSKKLTRAAVPLYAVAFALICWFVTANIDMLLKVFVMSGSTRERLDSTYACVAMWLNHPMGVGLGLYGYFFNQYDPSGLFPTDRLDYYPNNDPAMFLAYGGPLFLSAYFYTFYFVLRRVRSYWLLVAGLALLFQSASSYLFFNPAIILVFSLLLAMAEPIANVRLTSGRQFVSLGPMKTFPFGIRFFVRRSLATQRPL